MTPGVPSPPPIALPFRPADHELVRRLLEQEQIARTAPAPDWSEYLVTLARAALDALGRLLSPARHLVSGLGLSMDTVAMALLVVLAIVTVALATIVVLRLARHRSLATLPREAAAELDVAAAARDPGAWRALLEERLRAGGIAEALEALWWWLAASVSSGPVDPSWTSRELLARAGRPDLARWAAALDRMTYGARRPATEDVRSLLVALEAAV